MLFRRDLSSPSKQFSNHFLDNLKLVAGFWTEIQVQNPWGKTQALMLLSKPIFFIHHLSFDYQAIYTQSDPA